MQPALSSRRGSIDLFRIAGIHVAIDPSWLIIFFLIVAALAFGYLPQSVENLSEVAYLVGGVVGALFFFGSVLLHELAHSIVANRSGAKVRRITLFLFGGMAHLSGEPKSWKDEIKIAAVGPLTSFALAGLFFGLQQLALLFVVPQNLAVVLLGFLALVNLVLGAFNLLPGLPLDGGRIARGLFWRKSGDMLQATRRAARWGMGIGAALMLWGFAQILFGYFLDGVWLILIGLFVRGAAQSSVRGLLVHRAIEGVRVGDLMVSHPDALSYHTTIREAVGRLLNEKRLSFPVLFGKEPVGVLGVAQLKAGLSSGQADEPISTIMDRIEPRRLVSPNLPVTELLQDRWADGPFELIVMEGDQMVGWVTPSIVQRYVDLRTELGDLVQVDRGESTPSSGDDGGAAPASDRPNPAARTGEE